MLDSRPWLLQWTQAAKIAPELLRDTYNTNTSQFVQYETLVQSLVLAIRASFK